MICSILYFLLYILRPTRYDIQCKLCWLRHFIRFECSLHGYMYICTNTWASPREIIAVLGNIKLAIVRKASDQVFFYTEENFVVM